MDSEAATSSQRNSMKSKRGREEGGIPDAGPKQRKVSPKAAAKKGAAKKAAAAKKRSAKATPKGMAQGARRAMKKQLRAQQTLGTGDPDWQELFGNDLDAELEEELRAEEGDPVAVAGGETVAAAGGETVAAADADSSSEPEADDGGTGIMLSDNRVWPVCYCGFKAAKIIMADPLRHMAKQEMPGEVVYVCPGVQAAAKKKEAVQKCRYMNHVRNTRWKADHKRMSGRPSLVLPEFVIEDCDVRLAVENFQQSLLRLYKLTSEARGADDELDSVAQSIVEQMQKNSKDTIQLSDLSQGWLRSCLPEKVRRGNHTQKAEYLRKVYQETDRFVNSAKSRNAKSLKLVAKSRETEGGAGESSSSSSSGSVVDIRSESDGGSLAKTADSAQTGSRSAPASTKSNKTENGVRTSTSNKTGSDPHSCPMM